MMRALALLQTLRASGVELTLAPDGTVHYTAPKGTLTPALLEAMRQHKETLLDLLEWYEERAGILEFEAGLARADAEREAWLLLEARYGQPE